MALSEMPWKNPVVKITLGNPVSSEGGQTLIVTLVIQVYII